MTLNETLVRLSQVSVDFHGEQTTVAALRDVDLEIHSGQYLIIVGSNGSGKSTLLRVIADDVHPTRGSVYRAPALTRSGSTSIVTIRQNPAQNLAARLTVAEHLMLAGAIGSGALPWQRLRVKKGTADAAAYLHVLSDAWTAVPTQLAGELSGGQKQLLALAIALTIRPLILLLDEPTAALDDQNAHHFLTALRKAQSATPMACVIVTHDERVTSTNEFQPCRLAGGSIVSPSLLQQRISEESPT